jgi:hypothetical protein
MNKSRSPKQRAFPAFFGRRSEVGREVKNQLPGMLGLGVRDCQPRSPCRDVAQWHVSA